MFSLWSGTLGLLWSWVERRGTISFVPFYFRCLSLFNGICKTLAKNNNNFWNTTKGRRCLGNQINTLSRGLNFTTIAKLDIIQLKSDILDYTWELFFAKFLNNTPENIFSQNVFKQNLILHHPEIEIWN